MISCFHGDQFDRRLSSLQEKLIPTDQTILQSHIVILPSNRWKRRFIESILKRDDVIALASNHIFSYNEFLEAIYNFLSITEADHFNKKSLSPYLKEKLMKQVLQKLAGQFQYYLHLNSAASPKGSLRRFLRLIDELIMSGFSANQFKQAEKTESFTSKMADIALIFAEYEETVLSQFYDQNYLAYDLLRYYNEKQFSAQFGQIESISFLHFDKLSHSMLRMIERLSLFSKNIDLHYAAAIESELMQHTKYDLKYLDSLALNYVADAAAKAADSKEVFADSFESFEDEFHAILSQIYHLLESDEISENDIVLTYPKLEPIAKDLRLLCAQYNIRYNITSDLSLAENALIQFLLTIIRLYTENYHYLDLIRFFESPFIAKTAFNSKLLMAFVTERKTERIQGKILEEFQDFDKEGNCFLAIEKLIEKLKILFASANSSTALEKNFFSFLETFQVSTKLSELKNEANGRAFLRFKELFNQLNSIWSNTFSDFKLNIFLEDFVEELNSGSYQLREVKGTGIQIMPMLEARAEEPKVMFIAGLNQSVFPKSQSPAVLLNSLERDSLKLEENDFSVQEEKYILEFLLQKKSIHFLSDSSKNSERDARSLLLTQSLESYKKSSWPENHVNLAKTYKKTLSSNFDENSFKEIGLEKLDDTDLKKRFEQQTYSATQLERYIDCQYRFFVHDVLKINEQSELKEEQTAAEYGSLIHKILFLLYKENPNIRELPVVKRIEQIKKILNEELKRSEQNIAEIQITVSHIEEILKHDSNLAENYKATFFEWRFGNSMSEDEDVASTNEALELNVQGRKIRFRGQVDRIDLDEDGNAIIIDYKNTLKLKSSDILKGEAFQLLIYLLAAAELIDEVKEIDAAFIFAVGREKKVSKNPIIGELENFSKRAIKYKDLEGSDISFDEFLELSKERIAKIVERIAQGRFLLKPKDRSDKLESCTYCTAKTACRIREKLLHFADEIEQVD